MFTNLLNVEQAAEILGVSQSFIYKLARNKDIPVVKIKTSIRIRQEDLLAFIDKNLTKTELTPDRGTLISLPQRKRETNEPKKYQ